MKWMRAGVGILVLAGLAASLGCATGNLTGAEALKQSAKPAWSLKSSQNEMIVAASPMRRTLQIAGSTGLIVGASVDIVVNSEYRDTVRKALEGYDTNAVFTSCIESRLKETLPGAVAVQPLQSSAGYANEKEARQDRYRSLAKQGYDSVLDLRMRYGLYGTNVALVTEIDADLIAVPSGSKLWSTTVFATPEAALANDKLGNPQKKKSSSESAPQFSVDKKAFERWTANNGAALKESYEKAVQGVTDALLCDMGVASSAAGEMYRGKVAASRKEFVEANRIFEKAIQLDPALLEARNAQSVNYAQAGRVDLAIQVAEGIVKANPDFGPAWFNLAWWNATELDKLDVAKTQYAEALRLGMPADEKIEKALAGK